MWNMFLSAVVGFAVGVVVILIWATWPSKTANTTNTTEKVEGVQDQIERLRLEMEERRRVPTESDMEEGRAFLKQLDKLLPSQRYPLIKEQPQRLQNAIFKTMEEETERMNDRMFLMLNALERKDKLDDLGYHEE